MVINAPAEIMKIFESHTIHHESFTLNTELGSKPKADRVAVRAFDGFVFMKNSKFVYPQYKTSDPAWWNGVVAYGYTAALTGNFRFFIWAGQWAEDYEDNHFGVVRLESLEGICKEPSPHWRSGRVHKSKFVGADLNGWRLGRRKSYGSKQKQVTAMRYWNRLRSTIKGNGSQLQTRRLPFPMEVKVIQRLHRLRVTRKTKGPPEQELAAAAKRKRGAGGELDPRSKSPIYIGIDSDSDTNEDSDKSNDRPAKKRTRADLSTKPSSTRPDAQATQFASSTVKVSWTQPQTFSANRTGGQNKLVISMQMTIE